MIRKLAVVGGGAMGEALLAAAIAQDVCRADAIAVGEPMASRRAYLEETHGVNVDEDNAAVVAGADVAILAVKPQQIKEALPPLRDALSQDALAVSIMAGVPLVTIACALGTPAQRARHAQHPGDDWGSRNGVDGYCRHNTGATIPSAGALSSCGSGALRAGRALFGHGDGRER